MPSQTDSKRMDSADVSGRPARPARPSRPARRARPARPARPAKSRRLFIFAIIVLLVLIITLVVAGTLTGTWWADRTIALVAALAAASKLLATAASEIATDEKYVSERAAANLLVVASAANVFSAIFAAPAIGTLLLKLFVSL